MTTTLRGWSVKRSTTAPGRAAEVLSHLYEVGPVEGARDGEGPTGLRWTHTVVAGQWAIRRGSRRAGSEGDVDGLAHGVELEPGIGQRDHHRGEPAHHLDRTCRP